MLLYTMEIEDITLVFAVKGAIYYMLFPHVREHIMFSRERSLGILLVFIQ